MHPFLDTPAAEAFIVTADSRQTSPEIMRAIAFHARDRAEAEAIWDGGALDVATTLLAIWETATCNGARDVDLSWGAEGDHWADQFSL